jgi:peptidoglycan/LPS O-acetylase OafA/YrhL
MTSSKKSSSQRLAWIEGTRIFAAVMILLYHAQLLMTHYAFTPQPEGIAHNLSLIKEVGDRLGHNVLTSILSFPIWFGFQFVDVFILISGFSLVLSLKGKPLDPVPFLKHRFLRILWPFWTVAWLSYPVLWAIGKATDSYIPDSWHMFAGVTFPLLFDYAAEPLLPTSGPWWFVSLILSFTFIFPFLWDLLQRWGSRNLLSVSLLLTLGYRALAGYTFGGHPTYVVLDTPANWLPFVPFLAKLSTFVLGMVVAKAYANGKGPIFWHPRRALTVGTLLYTIGFISQFYWSGWIVADLLTPIGLTLCCMVAFRALSGLSGLESTMRWLGSHSYSYFLIHNFVIDRTIQLVVGDNLSLYYSLLPAMLLGTLVLSVIVDSVTPAIRQLVVALLSSINDALTKPTVAQTEPWNSTSHSSRNESASQNHASRSSSHRSMTPTK